MSYATDEARRASKLFKLAQSLATSAFEVQRRRIHEHNGQIGEQITPASKQSLLDEILDAARSQRPSRLLRRRKLLAEPHHRPIEMMQLQIADPLDAIVVTPI